MASMRDIKRRKESVQSTQQITKAMKLVSTVKLQKARGRAESNKPYFNMLYDTICSILAMTKEPNHKFLKENGSDKKAVIAITSNRGLAGGYNNNVVKEIVAAGFSKEDTYIYGIGKKGIEGLTRKGYSIYQDESEIINAPLFDDATELTKQLLTQYSKGEIGEVYIAYTNFKNTVTQEAKLMKLLPIRVLGDEMLTPDSSRFWPAEGYEPGHGQPSFDKQFARDWLKANEGHNWTLPQDIVDKTIDKYLQAYKLLTGKDL